MSRKKEVSSAIWLLRKAVNAEKLLISTLELLDNGEYLHVFDDRRVELCKQISKHLSDD
jgi:hypothetical protein